MEQKQGQPNETNRQLHSGCYNCGGGQHELLISKTVGGTSVSLCAGCQEMQTVPRMPFEFRSAK